MEGLKSLLQQ